MELVLGQYRELEKELCAFISDYRKKEPIKPILIILPSAGRLAGYLSRGIMEKNGSCVGVEFSDFLSLAKEIYFETADISRYKPVLSDGRFFGYLAKSIWRKIPHPDYGAPPPSSDGGDLLSAINDIIEANAGGSFLDLPDNIAACTSLAEEEKTHLLYLFKICGIYSETLPKLPFADVRAVLKYGAENIARSTVLQKYGAVIVYGFYDFTGLQNEFFGKINENYPVKFFMPYQDVPAHNYSKLFLESALMPLARDTKKLESNYNGTAVKYALADLFTANKAESFDGNVSFYCVSSLGDEIYLCAKEIMELASGGADYDDIAVIMRSSAEYGKDIKRIFNENKIPFVFSFSKPLTDEMIIKLCLKIAGLWRGNFRDEDIEEIARSPYFAGGTSEINLEKWTKGAREKLLLIEEGGNFEDKVSALLYLLEKSVTVSPNDDRAEAAFKKLKNEITAMTECGHCADCRPREFIDELKTRLESVFLSEPSGTESGVRIMDIMSARGLSFDNVILCGLNDKAFPRIVREEPFLKDKLRSFLALQCGFYIRPKADGYDEEKLLFYNAVSMAKEKLVCVYQRCDEDGKAKPPSVYLGELLNACGLNYSAVKLVPRGFADKYKGVKDELLSRDEIVLKTCLLSRKPDEELKKAELLNDETARALDFGRQVSQRNGYTAADGYIGGKNGLDGEKISPSSLKKLYHCPMRYFFYKALGMEEKEIPCKTELAHSEFGKLCHSALAGALKKYDGKNLFNCLRSAVKEHFYEDKYKDYKLYPLVWDSIARSAVKNIMELCESAVFLKSGHTPADIETEVSGKIDNIANAAFHGRIDRIDINPDGRALRVVDYKKSPPGKKLEKEFFGNGNFQPFIYTELARKAGHYEKVEMDILVFGDVKKEKDGRCFNYSDEEIKKLRNAAVEIVDFLISLVAKGEFFINHKSDECKYCDYARACRKRHQLTRFRADALPASRQISEYKKLAKDDKKTKPAAAL